MDIFRIFSIASRSGADMSRVAPTECCIADPSPLLESIQFPLALDVAILVYFTHG
jgi:hypothetical protein